MSKAKEQVKEQVKVKRYGISSFVNSEEFAHSSQLLSVLLVNGTKYSKKEVYDILEKYFKGEVN
jgi:hypothetical protein